MDCETSARSRQLFQAFLHPTHSPALAATAVLFFLLNLMPTLAGAQEKQEKRYPDRLQIRAGGFYINDVDTIAFLQAPNAPLATNIDFDRSLNMETSTTVARLDAIFRFNDRHALGATWYKYELDGRRTLAREIVFGDQTFTIGGDVNSSLNFDIYKLDYRYSLQNDEKVELGLGIGAHLYQVDIAVERPLAGQRQAEELSAPLPVFTLFASYNFTPRFELVTTYELFFINIEEGASGSLQDFLIGLEYRLIKHIGVGLAFNRFSADIQDEVDNSQLFVDHAWKGLFGYASVYF